VQLLDRRETVVNAVAKLVFSVQKYDHVTLLLRDLHWLLAPQRIEYYLAVCWRSVVNMEGLYHTCHRSSSVRLTLFTDDTCGRDMHGPGQTISARADLWCINLHSLHIAEITGIVFTEHDSVCCLL